MPPPKGKSYKTKPQIAEEAERAVRLRKLGASYREIAKILGMSVADVHYRVRKLAPEMIRSPTSVCTSSSNTETEGPE